MFQAQMNNQASTSARFDDVDKRMDTFESRLATLEEARNSAAPAAVQATNGGRNQYDIQVNDRTMMIIGGFNAFTEGEEMKKVLKPLVDSWGGGVSESRYPSCGRTCKVIFHQPQAMWDAINKYKGSPGNKLTHEGADIWVNVDLSKEERTASKKIRIAMDILKSMGTSETLKPRWSSCVILRTTGGQDKGPLCKIDPEANAIIWEPLAEKVLNPIQKTQVEEQFKARIQAM